MKSFFSDKEFYKKLWKLCLPIAFQSLMLALVAAADAFMLGNVEQNSMSAVSLATQVQFVQNMIICAVTGAASILGAQYWGKKDKKTLKEVFGMSIRVCFMVSALFFVACIFFPRYLMLIFTDEEVLISIGIGYLKIAGWSYILTGFSQCILTLMKVSDHPGMSAKISSFVVVLNIILNALFIFGFKMGVQGAAVATLISRITEVIASVLISLKKDYIFITFKDFLSRNKMLMQDFMKVFLPILGATLLWSIGLTSYSAFMGHLGVDAAGANSIAAVVRDLICCLCNGIATGGGIMVGYSLGAGKLEEGKVYGDRLVVLAFLCGLVSCVLMFAFTPAVLSFVKLTDKARYYLIGMMIIMAVYMIGRAVNTIIINGIFASGGDTLFDVYSLFVTMWCLAVPLAFIGTFVFNWPVFVVYACTCLDEVGKIPWVMMHYKKYKWVKDLTRDNLE